MRGASATTCFVLALMGAPACGDDSGGVDPPVAGSGGVGGTTVGTGGMAGTAAGTSSATGGTGGTGGAAGVNAGTGGAAPTCDPTGSGGTGAGGMDECPLDPAKNSMGQCGCNTPDDDRDCDGTADCLDRCPEDPNKVDDGTCDCGTPDVDGDDDGVADCVDAAPEDATVQEEGICFTAEKAAAPGTACDDGACPGALQCDGAGHCGGVDCPPPSCGTAQFRRFLGYDYWFCDEPVTWDQAIASCRAQSGRMLMQFDGPQAQKSSQVVQGNIADDVWIGANDIAVEGEWNWSGRTPDDGSLFWTGTADGERYFGAYAQWSVGSPGGGTAENCAILQAATGDWDDVPCDEKHGFVCWVEAGR